MPAVSSLGFAPPSHDAGPSRLPRGRTLSILSSFNSDQNRQFGFPEQSNFSEVTKKADAIIGMDLLKLSNFSIDLDSKKIIFHPDHREYTPAAGNHFRSA